MDANYIHDRMELYMFNARKALKDATSVIDCDPIAVNSSKCLDFMELITSAAFLVCKVSAFNELEESP